MMFFFKYKDSHLLSSFPTILLELMIQNSEYHRLDLCSAEVIVNEEKIQFYTTKSTLTLNFRG